MRNIYRQIAKKNGVTVNEVKRDMQSAIDYAYNTPHKDNVTYAYQKQVPHECEIPTPDELIQFATKKINDKK